MGQRPDLAQRPAAGYISGGPHRSYTGTVAGINNQPLQKAYKDWNTGWPENSWELTEPAIYTQAAYVQLLARSFPVASSIASFTTSHETISPG